MLSRKETIIYNPAGKPVIFEASSAKVVTPSDSTILEQGRLYVGTGGTVVVVLANDSSTATFTNVPDGSILPILVIQVYTTGTTASDILILR